MINTGKRGWDKMTTKENPIFDMSDLGCNKDLNRALCGEVSFNNKIILCDDCVFKLIEKQTRLKAEVEKVLDEFYSKYAGYQVIVDLKLIEELKTRLGIK